MKASVVTSSKTSWCIAQSAMQVKMAPYRLNLFLPSLMRKEQNESMVPPVFYFRKVSRLLDLGLFSKALICDTPEKK